MCTNKRPNVILVLTDDQGFGDLVAAETPGSARPTSIAFHVRRFVLPTFMSTHVARPRAVKARELMRKPNIVYFFVDDMGYGDASCLSPAGKIRTPNIDRLAREGMVFTDAHSSSAVCSPSRYSVLTGRYNWRSSLQQGIVDQPSQRAMGACGFPARQTAD